MNIEQRNEILNTISDLSKDAYGFRVRRDYAAMSDEELEATWDRYIIDAKESRDNEERAEEQAWDNHNTQINKIANDNNVSISTALRWDVEAYDVDGDIGYYCYMKGIAYAKENEIKRLLTA